MKVRIFLLVCALAVLSLIGITAANAKVTTPTPNLNLKANYSFTDDYEVPALTKYVQKKSKVKLNEYQAKTIVTTAIRQGNKLSVDPTLILAVAEIESEFDHKAKSSSSSAYGLMQVIPYLHKDKVKNRDMRQPKDQIVIGAEVLAEYIGTGGNVRVGLKKYSGGSDKYAAKVLKAQSRIRLHVVQDIMKTSTHSVLLTTVSSS